MHLDSYLRTFQRTLKLKNQKVLFFEFRWLLVFCGNNSIFYAYFLLNRTKQVSFYAQKA